MIDEFTGGQFQTNGYLLSIPGGNRILIDAPEGVANWLDSRECGIDLLLLTHLHYDHVVDVAALKRAHDCRVLAHSNPDPGLTLRSLLEQSIGWSMDLEPFEVDQLLAGDTAVEIQPGGPSLDILHVPGHSPDSLCFGPFDHEALESPPVLFGGDVLFRGGIGRTDFPHGDHKLLINGIREKIFALPDDSMVLSGHGPSTTVGIERRSNPFLAEF